MLQALLVATAILSYYGNGNSRLLFGVADFLGVGLTLGLALVTPLLLVTYLFDGNILLFVSIITLELKVSFLVLILLT